MRIIADFHIHSKYSRATSKDMEIPKISQWAKYKGINLVGTGDFTHPFWLNEIRNKLQEDGSGLLKLRDTNKGNLKFILTAEISSIYTQGGRTRKVHTIIFAPDIETVSQINDKLTGIGNLYSDGRPILGLSAKDLAKLVLDINHECLVIPAHAWTPWFSIFGSNSGFDSIQECYEELAPYIYSIETGLSSDPEMNWRLSSLDNITLISNSDAHNPSNLGREANVFEIENNNFSYDEIADILKTKDPKRFLYTIEFFPEEGKYHFDGHRKCNVVVNPFEEKLENNICPKCSKKITIGVLNRVQQLADRRDQQKQDKFPASMHLLPLLEIIAEAYGVGTTSQKVKNDYLNLVNKYNGEFSILIGMAEEDLFKNLESKIAQGIINSRQGNIKAEPGYDGEYGKIKTLDGLSIGNNQISLF